MTDNPGDGTTEDGVLFPAAAAVPRRGEGPVLATFRRLVAAGRAEGTIADVDLALVQGAEVLADALDTARRLGDLRGGYLAVQALPPFQRALHALRLPVELTAVNPGPPAPAADSGTPGWVRDAFGTAE